MDLLRLVALDPDDLAVISAHLQDSLLRVGDIAYLPRERRFAIQIRRFDWEAGRRASAAADLPAFRARHGRARPRASTRPTRTRSLTFSPSPSRRRAPVGHCHLDLCRRRGHPGGPGVHRDADERHSARSGLPKAAPRTTTRFKRRGARDGAEARRAGGLLPAGLRRSPFGQARGLGGRGPGGARHHRGRDGAGRRGPDRLHASLRRARPQPETLRISRCRDRCRARPNARRRRWKPSRSRRSASRPITGRSARRIP